MSDNDKPVRPSAEEILNLLTVGEWRRLERYIKNGSDWAWAVASVINRIAEYQETKHTRNHMEPGYDTPKQQTICTDFDAWMSTQPFADDYRAMLQRAFDAGVAQAMNYVAEDPEEPRLVEFAGGRTVQIIRSRQGVPFLVVSRKA